MTLTDWIVALIAYTFWIFAALNFAEPIECRVRKWLRGLDTRRNSCYNISDPTSQPS